MSSSKKLLQAAAGNAGESLYVEDVYSTYLYEGNGTSQTITNGIDLSGKGGLVWIKERAAAGSTNHALMDTERGGRYILSSSTTGAELTASVSEAITGFNSNGFDLGATYSNSYRTNNSGNDYASWSFRKAKKFFDVVTYTGNGDAAPGQTVAHNLGSTPGFIIIKRTDSTSDWSCYHSGLTSSDYYLRLNTTAAETEDATVFPSAPTDSNFYVRADRVNASGGTFVAYLFASDAGGFGDDEGENIIKCGSYTGAGANLEVNVGFEPQFVLIKCTTAAGTNWVMFDTMRGLPVDGNAKDLRPNASDAEGDNSAIGITSTGFLARNGIDGQINASGRSYIYIAIRRPMKTPEAGTEVFAPISLGTTTEPGFISGFVTDFTIHRTVNEIGSRQVSSRMTGNGYMFSDSTSAEGSISAIQWDFMNGSRVGNGTANANEIQWMFKRAAGFMDVVAYTGTGSGRTIAHNLGIAPSMMIIKRRNGTGYGWPTWHSGYSLYSTPTYNSYMKLNRDSAVAADATLFNSTLPTESVFSVGSSAETNQNNGTYIAYLFGEIDGISKFGSYTGTGSNIDIDCGFSAGARFILIKRLTPGAGDWFLWDSLRGITAGNDPYLLLNTTDAEATGTDYIDPLASGFTITAGGFWINIDTYKYIFYAIA